jgi:hypothetical protein
MLVRMWTSFSWGTNVISLTKELYHMKQQSRRLLMRLAFHSWRLVPITLWMSNRLLWPWLLQSRIGWQASQLQITLAQQLYRSAGNLSNRRQAAALLRKPCKLDDAPSPLYMFSYFLYLVSLFFAF